MEALHTSIESRYPSSLLPFLSYNQQSHARPAPPSACLSFWNLVFSRLTALPRRTKLLLVHSPLRLFLLWPRYVALVVNYVVIRPSWSGVDGGGRSVKVGESLPSIITRQRGVKKVSDPVWVLSPRLPNLLVTELGDSMQTNIRHAEAHPLIHQ